MGSSPNAFNFKWTRYNSYIFYILNTLGVILNYEYLKYICNWIYLGNNQM